MRTIAITGLLLGGCTAVYDSQYDDRAGELEELATEIFSIEQNVQLFTSGGDKLFWVDIERPADQTVLHSMVPPSMETLDYEWSRERSDFDDFRFGKDLVVQCSFSTAVVFDADVGADVERGRTGKGTSGCALDGNTVYFMKQVDGGPEEGIFRWANQGPLPDPPSSELELPLVVSFAGSELVAPSTFRVIGNTAIVTETNGDIYIVDFAIGEVTWLENEFQVIGTPLFDAKRVLFDTNGEGPYLINFADRSERSFRDAVADGGYHLSFKHGDVHEPADSSEFVIHKDHVIYRGRRGIFAYGLETGKVVDLLLDRGESFDQITYRSPAVTSKGFLYVQRTDGFAGEGAVLQIDLNGRLR